MSKKKTETTPPEDTKIEETPEFAKTLKKGKLVVRTNVRAGRAERSRKG